LKWREYGCDWKRALLDVLPERKEAKEKKDKEEKA
jgi:hypothetical protein